MAHNDCRRLLIALFACLAGTASSLALAQTGDAQDTNAVATVANGRHVDKFDDSIRRWMKSQALYWRREQYAGMASLAGTKEWYRKSHLINAQLYIQYANVAVDINDNGKQALDDLNYAESLIKEGERGAGKSETTQINQVTDAIDQVKSEITQSPSAGAGAQKTKSELIGIFKALRHIAEKG